MLYCKYGSFFPHTFSSTFFCGGEQVNSVICVWFYILTHTRSHTNCIELESELKNNIPAERTAGRSQSQGRFACLVNWADLQADCCSDQEHLSDGEQ